MVMNLMKRVAIVTLALMLLVNLASFGQDGDIIASARDAIKAGSAKELAKHLNQTVDLTIDGKLESYSKAQAEFVLRDFFKEHPPTEFTIIHQGQSKGGQPYAIGQYKSGDSTYRIWMKIKAVDKRQIIHEITIVKE